METFAPLKKVVIKMHHLSVIGSYSAAFRKCLEALVLPLFYSKSRPCLGLSAFKARYANMHPLQSLVLPRALNAEFTGDG